MLNIFYNIRKSPDFTGKPVILPNPNRITTKSKSAVLRLRFFRVVAARQELALVRTADARKIKALLPQGCFCFWSLMARGGRENGAKRRNPN